MDTSPSNSVSIPSRGEIVLGLLPFVMLGTAIVLFEAPLKPGPPAGVAMVTAGVLGLGGYVLILAVLLWAWLKEFPRWSMPYLGYGLIFALYFSFVATPGLVIFNIPVWGGELWGWRACAPVGLVALAGFLLSRPPWKPLFRLFEKIWKDWTFLAFGLYGFLPLVLPILQDEMDHAYSLWPTLIAVFIVAAGAALYLVYARKPFRSAFLLGGMFLAVLAVSIGSNFYWKTHSVDLTTGVRTLLTGPAPWQAIIIESVITAGILTLILAATGLVGLLRSQVGKRIA
jgi:hypothetical protein